MIFLTLFSFLCSWLKILLLWTLPRKKRGNKDWLLNGRIYLLYGMLHTQSNINVAKVAATNTKDHYDEDKEEEGDKVECEGGATEEASNKASSNCAGVK